MIRSGVVYVTAIVLFAGIPLTSFAAVSADIDINGSDGPVTITDGDDWNYSWTSSNATACQLTSPSGTTGVTLAGNGGPITSGHAWYPSVGGSTTLTLNCTDGTDSASDSVTISVTSGGTPGNPNVPGHHHHHRDEEEPETPVEPVGNFCPYLSQYMRIDFNNDTMQVIRLQAFLKAFEGYDYVNINGTFDEATRQAVNAFQLKYSSEVLAPWGISQPTGYVYLLTLRKINEIVCGPQAHISVPHQEKIVQKVPPKSGVAKEGAPKAGKAGVISGQTGFGTSLGVPLVGEASENNNGSGGKDIKDGLAVALLAAPETFSDFMQCIYEFILILIVLYILGSVLEDVFIKDNKENVLKKFFTKWGIISVGLVAAFIGAYLLGEWCLLLPILIVLAASIIWMFFYPKHESIRTKTAAWQSSVSARTKKLLNETKESIEVDQGSQTEKDNKS